MESTFLAEGQADLSDYFAQAGTDRSQGHYVTGETGVPLLDGVLARMNARSSACLLAGITLLSWVKSGALKSSSQTRALCSTMVAATKG